MWSAGAGYLTRGVPARSGWTDPGLWVTRQEPSAIGACRRPSLRQ